MVTSPHKWKILERDVLTVLWTKYKRIINLDMGDCYRKFSHLLGHDRSVRREMALDGPHVRCLILTPPPHDTVHCDRRPQADHIPLTVQNMLNLPCIYYMSYWSPFCFSAYHAGQQLYSEKRWVSKGESLIGCLYWLAIVISLLDRTVLLHVS
jgi:hypothetical protein